LRFGVLSISAHIPKKGIT